MRPRSGSRTGLPALRWGPCHSSSRAKASGHHRQFRAKRRPRSRGGSGHGHGQEQPRGTATHATATELREVRGSASAGPRPRPRHAASGLQPRPCRATAHGRVSARPRPAVAIATELHEAQGRAAGPRPRHTSAGRTGPGPVQAEPGRAVRVGTGRAGRDGPCGSGRAVRVGTGRAGRDGPCGSGRAVRVEPSRAGPGQAEPGRARAGRAGPGQGRASPGRPGQSKPGQDHARPGPLPDQRSRMAALGHDCDRQACRNGTPPQARIEQTQTRRASLRSQLASSQAARIPGLPPRSKAHHRAHRAQPEIPAQNRGQLKACKSPALATERDFQQPVRPALPHASDASSGRTRPAR
jgi:hypothetical protein